MSHDFRPLIAAALMTLPLAGTLSLPAHSEIVARDIHIIIDKTNDENKGFMGQDHEARAFYDDAQVDPATHRVKILHEQHTPMLIPKHPDPNIMPVGNAWLDLGSTPIRYHFAASPGVECLPGGKTMWKSHDHPQPGNRRSRAVRALHGRRQGAPWSGNSSGHHRHTSAVTLPAKLPVTPSGIAGMTNKALIPPNRDEVRHTLKK